jgi:DNA-directed RNA polymerase specialized sigma24 family protein
MRDSTGRYTYAFEISHMKTVVLPSAQRLTYIHDAIGERCDLAALAADRFTLGYDSVGRINQVPNTEAQRTTGTYDARIRAIGGELPNGLHTTCTYDPDVPGLSQVATQTTFDLLAPTARYTIVSDDSPAAFARTQLQPPLVEGLPTGRNSSPYDLFNALCGETDAVIAGRLIREFIEHPETRGSVDCACRRMLAARAVRSCDGDDLVQEALAIFMARLRANVASYRDLGPAQFRGWLQKLGRAAAVDASRHLRVRDSRRLHFVAPERLTKLAVASAADELSLDVRGAIEGIVDDRLQRILVDRSNGLMIGEIAARLELSRSAAYRLWEAARTELAKRLASDC